MCSASALTRVHREQHMCKHTLTQTHTPCLIQGIQWIKCGKIAAAATKPTAGKRKERRISEGEAGCSGWWVTSVCFFVSWCIVAEAGGDSLSGLVTDNWINCLGLERAGFLRECMRVTCTCVRERLLVHHCCLQGWDSVQCIDQNLVRLEPRGSKPLG